MEAGERVPGALACSDGTIVTGCFNTDLSLFVDSKALVMEENAITMACDYGLDRIASGMSSGSVITRSEEQDCIPIVVGRHDLEIWTVHFDLHHNNLLHSGGDDSIWRGWDLRSEMPALTCHYHSAGVCSIVSHPTFEQLIITGSYDRQCALWDRRNLRQPQKTIIADSGVWKLKWHPDNKRLVVLAACMYAGNYIFDFDGTDPQVVQRYDSKSLAYGCAWIDWGCVATCSFYNRELQIWELDDKR